MVWHNCPHAVDTDTSLEWCAEVGGGHCCDGCDCARRSDWFPMGFTAAMGFTNGHLQSLVYMHSPQAVPRRARDRCGPIINFALCIGYSIGSVLSFAFVAGLQAR